MWIIVNTEDFPSLQFSLENECRVMISSRDSKVRVFEDMDVVYKYGGEEFFLLCIYFKADD